MKVGILTLPFNSNYGGFLQAAALQKIVRQCGHEPVTLQWVSTRWMENGTGARAAILQRARQWHLHWYLTRMREQGWLPAPLSGSYILKAKYMRNFRSKWISETPFLHTPPTATEWERLHIDACIVGSDQVWRPDFLFQDIEVPFLSFVPQEIRQRSLTYAASFGSNMWDAPPATTRQCRELLQQFRAVSVREDTAISLCKEILGTDACWMPDPTLLLGPEDYETMAANSNLTDTGGKRDYLVYYILDINEQKTHHLKELSAISRLPLIDAMYGMSLDERIEMERKGRIIPCRPIEDWLQLMRHATYVVTDSFHGTAFSLIFGHPFECLGNTIRGNSRFVCLLGKAGLMHRLIQAESPAIFSPFSPKENQCLQQFLARCRQRGRSFIASSLTGV